MTDILPVTNGSARQTSAQTITQQNANSLSGVTSDFETFLRMLTAQAQYQDPLEPIDSTEYAAQLAQFSMVEQQVQTNEFLQSLLSDMAQSGLSTLGGWIGMQVRSPAQTSFSGQPVVLSPELAAGALDGVLVVKAQSGQVMQRVDFRASDGSVTWDGLTQDGATAPFGNYSFDVESWREGSRIATEPAQKYDLVREAQIQNDEIYLVLQDGRKIASNTVTALRN